MLERYERRPREGTLNGCSAGIAAAPWRQKRIKVPRQGWKSCVAHRGPHCLLPRGWICSKGWVEFLCSPVSGTERTHLQLNLHLPETWEEPGAVPAGPVAGPPPAQCRASSTQGLDPTGSSPGSSPVTSWPSQNSMKGVLGKTMCGTNRR